MNKKTFGSFLMVSAPVITLCVSYLMPSSTLNDVFNATLATTSAVIAMGLFVSPALAKARDEERQREEEILSMNFSNWK